MGLERTINGTVVNVGSGVNVGAEIAVEVGSNTGIANAVCVNAALAVWAIKRFIEFGSRVGAGATTAGAHAKISKRISDQNSNFLAGIGMNPLL